MVVKVYVHVLYKYMALYTCKGQECEVLSYFTFRMWRQDAKYMKVFVHV